MINFPRGKYASKIMFNYFVVVLRQDLLVYHRVDLKLRIFLPLPPRSWHSSYAFCYVAGIFFIFYLISVWEMKNKSKNRKLPAFYGLQKMAVEWIQRTAQNHGWLMETMCYEIHFKFRKAKKKLLIQWWIHFIYLFYY